MEKTETLQEKLVPRNKSSYFRDTEWALMWTRMSAEDRQALKDTQNMCTNHLQHRRDLEVALRESTVACRDALRTLYEQESELKRHYLDRGDDGDA